MPVLFGALGRRQTAGALLRRTTPAAAAPAPAPRRRNLSLLSYRHKPSINTRARNRRFQSTDPNSNPKAHTPPPPPPPDPPGAPQAHRISRILTSASRFLPGRLRSSLQGLRSAPLSHVGAFLVLHEITAVLPIFGLTYAFYVLDWVPTSWVLGPWAAWAEDGLKKYVPYFRKKRWFGLERKKEGEGEGGGRAAADGEDVLESELREEARRERERKGKEGARGWFARFSGNRDTSTTADGSVSTVSGEKSAGEGKREKAAAAWRKVKQAATVDNTEKGYKIGIQIAAAYTITKLLLVPRIALSLWLTPWLARSFVGLRHAIRKKKA